jgi:methyltransferase family protein
MLQLLIRRLDKWAYRGDTPVARGRRNRMMAMLKLVRPPPDAKIIDLGGTEYVWKLFDHHFQVTTVNLPGAVKKQPSDSRFTHIEADATNLRTIFANRSFDLAFSNSVIEHVGNAAKQQAFADEARRLAGGYWVQTPSDQFPIEAHTGYPYYWRLPGPTRAKLMKRWKQRLPEWAEMISGTTVLPRRRMIDLFPDGRIFVERQFGLEKSYAMYKRCESIGK